MQQMLTEFFRIPKKDETFFFLLDLAVIFFNKKRIFCVHLSNLLLLKKDRDSEMRTETLRQTFKKHYTDWLIDWLIID